MKLNNLLKYISKKIKSIVIFILLLPVLILIRLLKKFVRIRFRRLRVERIGHQAAEVLLYMCDRAWDITPANHAVDLLYYPKKNSIIANKFLFKLHKRRIKSLKFNWLVRNLHHFNNIFPGYENNEMQWRYDWAVDCKFLTVNTGPLLTLKRSEVKQGADLLAQHFNCKSGEEIICFFNRDKAYLDMAHAHTGRDFSYHDWRDSNIQHYAEALRATSFIKKYKFFRMGKHVEKSIENPHGNIIDYAISSHRSDFLDIYLMARAKFIVCANTGFGHIGAVFRKKMACINICPILTFKPQIPDVKGDHFAPNFIDNLIIFKKYYSKNLGRLLNLTEIINMGAQYFHTTEEYERNGINLIENTTEEIKALAEEMELRINNEWEETSEDIYLQNKFWNIVGVATKDSCRMFYPKIGKSFLVNNKWLLE